MRGRHWTEVETRSIDISSVGYYISIYRHFRNDVSITINSVQYPPPPTPRDADLNPTCLGARQRPAATLRDSPTYEDFGDPLEARRRKRREERETAGGASQGAARNGAGRGRQYISSFEVADKVIRSLVL